MSGGPGQGSNPYQGGVAGGVPDQGQPQSTVPVQGAAMPQAAGVPLNPQAVQQGAALYQGPGYQAMPQPAGQYVGAPLVQGEAKLKRSPLILGFVGWVFVACSFLVPYLLIRDAIKSGHPEGAGWVWILFLIMWIGLVAPVNLFGVVLAMPSPAVPVSEKQRKLNTWGIALNVSPWVLGVLGFVGASFYAFGV